MERRSAVKTTEGTHEKDADALHGRRESGHFEVAFAGAGVDAVVFDPDPVRGGKIVIQAKRYTYTVDVSSVRDLYGTVLNEGAMKGILFMSSSFGPDACEFAKDKPLTLLSGSNMLPFLQGHGVKAHIDLTARSTRTD